MKIATTLITCCTFLACANVSLAAAEDVASPVGPGLPIMQADSSTTLSITPTVSVNPPYLFPMPGARELVFYLEGKDSLAEKSWTTLARKIGNEDWTPFVQGIEVEEVEGGVSLNFTNAPTAKFVRLRADADENYLSDEGQAARFLKQATFGSNTQTIQSLVDSNLDFAGWIDAQMALPASYHLDHYYSMGLSNPIDPRDIRDEYRGGPPTLKVTVWWDLALLSEDQLRQRMAWALSQIFVMGEAGSKGEPIPDPMG